MNQEREVVQTDEVRDRAEQVSVGERDVRRVHKREETEDAEEDDERCDIEVRRDLRVDSAKTLATRPATRRQRGRPYSVVRRCLGSHRFLGMLAGRAAS